MINVIATFTLSPGKRNAFLREFHRVVPLVHREDGCVYYQPAVDVDSGIDIQPALREHTVTIIEKWENLLALRAHLEAEHMAEFFEIAKPMIDDLTVHVMQDA